MTLYKEELSLLKDNMSVISTRYKEVTYKQPFTYPVLIIDKNENEEPFVAFYLIIWNDTGSSPTSVLQLGIWKRQEIC